MKKYTALTILFLSLLLVSCSGSDTYQGTWKAINARNGQLEIKFEPKQMTLKKADGETSSYGYTQNGISIENGKHTYTINVDNGRTYLVYFPISGNTEKGVIADENENIIYTIGKNNYYTYDDIYGLE